MSRDVSKLAVVFAVALLVAWVLAACSSGDGSTTTSASTASQTTAQSRADGVETGPLKVVGGGSRSYRIPGHHTNVPSFAEESSRAELEAAAAVQHGYLVARVEKDWPKVCSYVSGILLQRLASHSKQQDCTKILARVTKPGPGGSEYESSEVEAESLRANGVWAFLLYRAATAPYYMPMIKEEGAWKVDSVAPRAFYG